MKVLVFDTETTNVLPKYASLLRKYLSKFPHIVQLSFILYDTEKQTIIDSGDYVIKINEDIELPESSVKIHGITREIMRNNGIDIKDALKHLKECYSMCDVIVAHNIKFDNTMLIVESMRNEMPVIIEKNNKNISHYCTMSNSIEMCNIVIETETGSYKKFPKQIELHEYLFPSSIINTSKLHNSFNDILVCLRCYIKMIYNEDIIEKNNDLKKYFKMLLNY